MLQFFKSRVAWIIIPFAVVLPLFIKNPYHLRVLDLCLIYSIVALSVNLIVGFCGLLDFGRAAFIAIGAYTSAMLTTRLNLPFPVAFLASGLSAASVGAVLGVLGRKSAFDYLTLMTIGLGEIVRLVLLNWTFTGGALGIKDVPPPALGPFKITSFTQYYYLALACLIITYVLISRIIKTKMGRAFMAIRDDPVAAAYSGINVPRYKVYNFALASFFTGIAGCLQVHLMIYASPFLYTMDESIYVLQMPILGGLGSLPGSILGTFILIIVPEISRTFYEYRLMFLGLIMVLMMTWMPRGILGGQGVLHLIVRRFADSIGDRFKAK